MDEKMIERLKAIKTEMAEAQKRREEEEKKKRKAKVEAESFEKTMRMEGTRKI